MKYESFKIENLKGKKFISIEINKDVNGDNIIFTCDDKSKYIMHHIQDCCENVYIEDINGSLEDILNEELILIEEVSNNDEKASESATWTFYKFATVKGYVDIRWYGESNGYYSEYVNFCKII